MRPGSANPALVWINYGKTRLHEIRTKSYAKRPPPMANLVMPPRAPLPLKILDNCKNTGYMPGITRHLVKRKRNADMMPSNCQPHTPEMTVSKFIPSPKRPRNHVPPHQLSLQRQLPSLHRLPLPRHLLASHRLSAKHQLAAVHKLSTQRHLVTTSRLSVPHRLPTQGQLPHVTFSAPCKHPAWNSSLRMAELNLNPPAMIYHY